MDMHSKEIAVEAARKHPSGSNELKMMIVPSAFYYYTLTNPEKES